MGKLQTAMVSSLVAREKTGWMSDDDDDDVAGVALADATSDSASEDKKKAKKEQKKKKSSSRKASKKNKKSGKKAKDSTSSSSSSSSTGGKKDKHSKSDKKEKAGDGKTTRAGAALLSLLHDEASIRKALFAGWPLSEIQKFGASVDTARAALPDLKTLNGIFATVLEDVLKFYDLAEAPWHGLRSSEGSLDRHPREPQEHCYGGRGPP